MSLDELTVRAETAAEEAGLRADRVALLAFLGDADSEKAVRAGFAELTGTRMDIRRGNIRQAIAALRKTPTPGVLLVDISGDSEPLGALADLSEVVEPTVRVLVVGDRQDVNFYRALTRTMGVVEYLYKPLAPDMIARHFAPSVGSVAAAPDGGPGGRVLTITGSGGGVGATTLAANLAWYLAEETKRHTVLLDPDLFLGASSLLLGVRSSPGLRTALENPDRVDALFVERAAQPAGERLHVLSGEEKLAEPGAVAPGAAGVLLGALRRRYNFVVIDARFEQNRMARDWLDLAHQRVLVMEPTLASIRNAARLLALPAGSAQRRRAVLVLNRAGQPGALNLRQVEEALELKPDVVVPYLPRQTRDAANLGKLAAAKAGGLRQAVVALAHEVAFAGTDASAPAAKGRWKLPWR